MVRKAKKYLLPMIFGGVYGFEEEEEAKIKIKPEHAILISFGIGTLILLLRFLI
jgi:preprotein translocase subunit Sec61beta